MIKQKKTHSLNDGFSLVELIIVIAIMAVLIGILAPQFIKYVDKSRTAKCSTNRGSTESAFQVECSDNDTFLNKAIANASDSDELKELAAQCMDSELTCPSGGTLSYSFQIDSNTLHITCSEHDDEGTLPDSTSNPQKSADALMTALQKWNETSQDWSVLDSNGTNLTPQFQKILDEALAQAGFKMSPTAIWRVNKNTSGSGYKIYWLDTGSELKAGTYEKQGMQINLNEDGTYTTITDANIYLSMQKDPNNSGSSYLAISNKKDF